MRANPFEGQLERLARTLTEQFGVQVICQGDQAYTDGKHIVLPSLPKPMESDLERMVVGFLDHEMSHVAFSDFSVVKEFSEKHPGYEGMLKVVEDALIERRAMQRWPGVRANLDDMFRQIRGRVAENLARSDPFHRFCTAVYLKLSHHADMLGLEPEIADYEDLLDQFPGVRTTRDAAALAERILDRWLNQQPQPDNSNPEPDASESEDDQSAPSSEEPQSQPDHQDGEADATDAAAGEPDEASGDSAQDSDPTDLESSGQDNANGDGIAGDDSPSATQDTDAPEPADEASDNDSAKGQSPSQPENGEAVGAEGSDDQAATLAVSGGQGGTLIGRVLTEAIAERAAQTNSSTEYRVFSKEYDEIKLLPVASEQDVKELLLTGVDTVRRLRRGLANALRSAEKRWWREDQSRGGLSPRTLHRLCVDRSRLDVFRTRSLVQGRSTAVCIVLDASGSMTSQKMSVARESMRVLLEALGDLKIATEAFTFTTGHAFDLYRAAQQLGEDPTELRERFSRFANLEIGVIKQFAEPAKMALRRLPSIRGTGLTPLGEAMHIGAGHIITRPESRKIMLVLTDGRAGYEAQSNAAHLHAQSVAQRISRAGIELIGVGIKDLNLCEIIEDTIVVYDLTDLPAQLCKLLGRTLRKGMRHVG